MNRLIHIIIRQQQKDYRDRSFFSQEDIKSAITEDVIRQAFRDKDNNSDCKLALDHIDSAVKAILNGGHRIFAILALIRQTSLIQNFIEFDSFQESGLDQGLPFEWTRLQRILVFETVAKEFFEKQWSFSSPVFSSSVFSRPLPKQTIFPFTKQQRLDEGAFGIVYEIQIPKSHHRFSKELFVRKQFSPGKRQSNVELESKPNHQRDFERELQNLSRLKLISHPNILELLCCYECNGDFNLIFPKAQGGNLRHIFDGRQCGTLTTEDDLVLALPGLCSAVRAIHDFVHEDQDTSFRLTGFHHDLKPENILTEAGKFILADFGIAQLKEVALTSETSWKAPHPYYGPPECYITEPGFEKPRIRRSSDIWSLGCIMAEIIAFMGNGPEGIEIFRKDRIQRSSGLVTYRFHRFGAEEPGVSRFLATQQQDDSVVHWMLGRLVSEMLEIEPRARPSASAVEARMQVIAVSMICHDISALYVAVTATTETFAVLIEQTRFNSWKDVCGIPPNDKDGLLRITWSAKNPFQDALSSLQNIRRHLKIAKEANSLDSDYLQAVRQMNDLLIERLPEAFQAQTQEYTSSQLDGKGDLGDVTSDQQEPLPLVGRVASQQGSIDWVNLVTKALSFPVGVLARLSATRVDPYTLTVGQAMSQKFQLGPVGRQNMKRALGKLKSFASFGDVFSFGFSPQSFVRTLSRTDEGGSLLALCAALGECFQEDLVAEVLHSLAQSYKAPESLTPSTFEWLALTSACSGLLSATDFPVLAEQLMSIAPNNGKFSSNRLEPFENIAGRGFPSNDDLANALKALCRVSCKELTSICIRGGPACGWLGAVAAWLLDLSVTVSDGQSLLYSSHAQGSNETQVQLIFMSKSSEGSEELELISNTYRLRESTEFLQLEGVKASHTTMTGRLSWDTCLSAVFGSHFRELMKKADIVGSALGCTARIFEAIVQGDSDFASEDVSIWCFYFEESIGAGFVENTLRWFPELSPAKLDMETSTEMTILKAKMQYEQDIALIQRLCHCRQCKEGSGDYDSERFCLLIILETIIILSLALSGMFVAEDLRPTRAGIEIFYSNQVMVRDYQDDRQLGPFCYIMQMATEGSNYQFHQNYIFVKAIQIFAGRVAFQQDSSSNVSARSSYGLCLYLDTLCEISLDKERLRRLHVVPGRIERHGRPFDLVTDRKVNNEELSDFMKKTTIFTDVSLLCMEKARSLRVSFMLRGEGGKTSIHIGPAGLATTACLALGRVWCRGYRCPKLVAMNNTGGQIQKYSLGSREVHVCQGDHLLQSVLLYLGMGDSDFYKNFDLYSTLDSYRVNFILRSSRECLQCCFRAAAQVANDQPIIILA